MEQNSTRRNIISFSIAFCLSLFVISLLHSKEKETLAKAVKAGSQEHVTSIQVQN